MGRDSLNLCTMSAATEEAPPGGAESGVDRATEQLEEGDFCLHNYYVTALELFQGFSSKFFRQSRQINCRNSELDENFG